MKRLLLDVSHIAKTTMFSAKKGERSFVVGDERIAYHGDAFEHFLVALKAALRNLNMKPEQVVVVKDGANAKVFRRQFIPEYCVREKRTPEFGEQYRLLEEKICDMLMKHGAICVSKAGVEADDIIAALSKKTDCIIWSGDWDLCACGVPVYFQGSIKEEKFPGIPPNGVTLYKVLVGDPSDKLTGVVGFGEVAYISMLEKFGMESIDEVIQLLDNEELEELEPLVAEFPQFRKVIDQKDHVYNTYKCVKFYHPGYDLKWEMLYPEGTEYLPGYTKELVTKDNFESAKAELIKDIKGAINVSLDIETDTCEESRQWCLNAMSESDKAPPVDTIGSELCGFSITASNNTKYFSVDHAETNNISLKQAEEILNLLPEDKPIAVHNTIFELPVLRNHFELKFDRGWLPLNTYDTRILAGYVDENDSAGLKNLAKRWLKYDQQTYESVLAGRSGMSKVTGKEVMRYGCDDTIVTNQLFSFFELFTLYEDSFHGYEIVDQAAQFMYAEAFLNGIVCDTERLDFLRADSNKRYTELQSKVDKFLANLSREETEAQPITLETLKAVREGREVAPPNSKVCRWPGCEFIPPEKETVSEIKRMYKIWKGEELKTAVRSVGKVLDQIGLSFEELVDLASLNFRPAPELNLRSPKQIGYLLYEVLQYPVRIHNKLTDKQREAGQRKGNPSTNEDAIAHAIIYDASEEEKEFLENLIATKACLTEESLYFSAYPRYIHWKTGKMHPNPGQAMAVTGRSTPSRPNLTQMTKPDGTDQHTIREVVIDDEDYFILSMDMNSQELVHIAEQSGDPEMIACYSGEVRKDLHSKTGASIYSLRYEAIDYDEFRKAISDEIDSRYANALKCRKNGKTTNFLDAYLGSAASLSVKLRVPLEDAEVMIEAKHLAFPGVVKWQDFLKGDIKEKGYSVEPMGRRRHTQLDGTWKDDHAIRGSINHIIQGGAGSQIKCILSTIWKQRLLEDYTRLAKFLFSVHDETVFAIHKADMLAAVRRLHPAMTQQYANFKLQFESSIAIGKNFGELVELGSVVDEEKILEVVNGKK